MPPGSIFPATWRSLAVGIGGGLSSAGLFYSATGGAVGLSTLLFILTPLPSLIAGFGWGLGSAVVAGITGAIVMAVIASIQVAVGYVFVLAAPVAGITHLLLLARYDAAGQLIDWFSAGRLLAAIALYGALLPAALAQFGDGSYQPLEPELQRFLKQTMEQAPPGSGWRGIGDDKLKNLAQLWVVVMPAVVGSYWTLFLSINVYLAAQATRISGYLARPWPDLRWINIPVDLVGMFALALAGIWFGGVPRALGVGVAGALAVAFVLQGLSVVHAVGRARLPWLLPTAYAMLVVAGYVAAPLLIVAGLVEATFGLRERLVPKPVGLPLGTV